MKKRLLLLLVFPAIAFHLSAQKKDTNYPVQTGRPVYKANVSGDDYSRLATAPEPSPDSLDLFPNPAVDAFTLRYGTLPVRDIRLFAADGRWVSTIGDLTDMQMMVGVSDLPAGLYAVQLRTDLGNLSRKLCIVK